VGELAREHGVSVATLYGWKSNKEALKTIVQKNGWSVPS
jgi:hypothetical protein